MRQAINEFLAALHYLMRLPVARPAGAASLARATAFFPLIGLGIGAVAVGTDWVCRGLPLPLRSALVVMLLAVASGGLSLDGVARTCRALGRGRDREGALAALADAAPASTGRRAGSLAAAAAIVALLSKILAVHALSSQRGWAFLFAPMLSRWSMVVCGYSARTPRLHGVGYRFVHSATFREFALTSVFTFAATFAATEAVGIFVVVCVALATVGLRLLWHAWLGGVTEAIVWATGEMVETLALVLFAVVG